MPTLTPNKDSEVNTAQAGNTAYQEQTVTPSGTGKTNIVYTVPTGKKWILKAHGARGSGLTGSTNNYELEVLLSGQTDYVIIYEDSSSGLGGNYLNNDIVLNAGDKIRQRINFASYTSGDVLSTLIVLEQDA